MRKKAKARRRKDDGKNTHKTGVITKYFVTKLCIYGNGTKRMAEDTDEMNETDGVMMDKDGGVHGRNCDPKRTRKMLDFVPAQVESGAKSTTPVEPSIGEDSDSSQLTTCSKNGSGKPLKKLKSNYLKKSHGRTISV